MNIKIDSLKLAEKVLLAALLSVPLCNKTKFSFGNLLECGFSPAPTLTVLILSQLASSNLVKWGGNNLSNKRILQEGDSYDFDVSLVFDHSEKALSDLLLQINSDERSVQDEAVIVSLIKNIFVAECIQFIFDQLSLTFFDIDLMMNPPVELIELLDHYTLAELHTLLWMAASKISTRQKKEESASNLLSHICRSAQRSALLYAANENPIELYQKQKNSEGSVATVMLMENILELDSGSYFTGEIWTGLSKDARYF